MNKTKRKIFEASMKLFAEKGYEATSVEEITSLVGVAKGTLYYHFSSKEEIFNFLAEEGMKLLYNSTKIKIDKADSYFNKIKAIIIVELKVMYKYEDFITILLTHIWGKEPINNYFRKYIYDYISLIEETINEGILKKSFKKCNTRLASATIFGLMCPLEIYKIENDFKEEDILKLASELTNNIIEGIK